MLAGCTQNYYVNDSSPQSDIIDFEERFLEGVRNDSVVVEPRYRAEFLELGASACLGRETGAFNRDEFIEMAVSSGFDRSGGNIGASIWDNALRHLCP